MRTKAAWKTVLQYIGGAALLCVMLYVWKCPFRLFFGVPCAGCGFTRAVKAAAHLHFAEAFSDYPLFLLVPPVAFYLLFAAKLPKRFCRRTEKTLGILLIALFFGVYLYRLIFLQDNPVMTVDLKSGLFFRFFF